MTKNFKLVLALVLSLMMVLPSVAMAADDFTLTINNTVENHTYTAYQIFKGTKKDHDATTNSLGDVEWGSGITTAGKKALYTAYSMEVADADLDKDTNIQALMEKIADKNNTSISASDKAVKFANVFFTTADNGSVTMKDGVLTGGNAQTASGESVVFNNLASGYYLVNDAYTSTTGEILGTDYSIARIAVQVVGNVTINNKADKPTVDKKIDKNGTYAKTDNDLVDNNTANIGDDVLYVATSKVPEYEGYKEYYMDFTDTLSKGLTFKTGSMKVKINGEDIAAENYTVNEGTYDATSGTTITVHLKDLVSRSTTFPVGAKIELVYTATVNDNAVIGNTGNPNKIKLDYTNHPENSGDGTPDNVEDIPHGTTPEYEVNTFVTEIDLTKVVAGTSTPLPGAVFNVKGSQIKKVLITGQHFVEATTDGTHYKLNDGTYTDKAPTELTKDSYASQTQMYKLEAYGTASVQETKDLDFEVVSDASGKVKITGLKEGTYTIKEIQAPSGYNLLKDEIVIVVESNVDTITDKADFKWTKGAGTTIELAMERIGTEEPATYSDKNVDGGTYKANIENSTGAELPETGGIGTTIFYVAGSIMVLAAAILLITKRRMGAND